MVRPKDKQGAHGGRAVADFGRYAIHAVLAELLHGLASGVVFHDTLLASDSNGDVLLSHLLGFLSWPHDNVRPTAENVDPGAMPDLLGVDQPFMDGFLEGHFDG